MAERDIDTLRKHMPDLFENREPGEQFDPGVVFVDIPNPDHPDPTNVSDANAPINEIFDDEFASLDRGFFDPNLEIDLRVELTIERLVGTFGGEFAGAPKLPMTRTPRPPTECLAFYLPFHYFHPTWWGVYLIVEGIWLVAKHIWRHSGGATGPLTPDDCWIAARLYLFYHEIFHHNIESFATRLEVAHRKPLYIGGFERFYSRHAGTPSWIEESLAEANAYTKTTAARFFAGPKQAAVKSALKQFIASGPPGYAEGARFLRSGAFSTGRNRLAEESVVESIPTISRKPITVWNSTPHMMRGFNDKAKGRAKYVVSAGSPLAARIRIRPRLKPLDLKRKLKKFGCYFVRDGGNHEWWQAPNGKRFAIPRHPGDLGNGLIRAILREAGIELSLHDFASG